MSNYATLKTAIQSAVYTNGNNEITGAGLQAVLLQIVNTIGDGYVFKGVATAGTSPGTPDANVFYVAPAGTYTNFGSSYTVPTGSIGVFSYNGSWNKSSIEIFDGYVFQGTAQPTTAITPNGKDFYIVPAGTYENFGNPYTVPDGNIGLFMFNGVNWLKYVVSVLPPSSVGGNITENVNTILNGGDATLAWESGGIDSSTGKETTVANRERTGYVNIAYNRVESLVAPKYMVMYYDIYKRYITFDTWYLQKSNTLNSPTDARYYRLLADTSFFDYTMLSAYYGGTPALKRIDELDKQVNTGATYSLEWLGEGYGINVVTGADMTNQTDRNCTRYIPMAYNTIDAGNKYYLVFYDSAYTFISSVGWLSADVDAYAVAPEGSAYYRILIDTSVDSTGNYDVSMISLRSMIGHNGGSYEIIVDANGNGDYTTIEDALANAGDSAMNHVIITVMPGTYYPAPKDGGTPYTEGNRNLTIRGVDKNVCILRGDVGYYRYQDNVDYSILRLNGNVTIENLTIQSLSGDYATTKAQKGWTSTTNRRAYCIHVDGNRQSGDVVEIRNCALINDHFSAVGFGLRPDTTLRIVDCYCEMTVAAESDGESYGTLYGHLWSTQAGDNQRVEVLRCQIVNTNAQYSLDLRDSGDGVRHGYAKIIQNVAKTTDTQNSFKYVESVFTINEMNFGNQVLDMNYQ